MKNEQRQQKIDEINSQFDFCKKLVVDDFKQSANQWDKYPWINKQSLSGISGCGFSNIFETGKDFFELGGRTMTIGEAILHAQEIVEKMNDFVTNHRNQRELGFVQRCEKCAEEHRQLEEWLKDYKRLLEKPICEDAISRAELLEHVWRDKLDSRELIAELVERMPTVKPVACIAKISFDENKMKQMVDEVAKDIVEQCEDCISRESAKIEIREKFKDLPIRCEINEVLNGIPSVQPARPKGEWIDGFCEKCGYDGGIESVNGKMNFCPNCGADMREPMLKEAGQYDDNDTMIPAT